jgi:hypothetical protein
MFVLCNVGDPALDHTHSRQDPNQLGFCATFISVAVKNYSENKKQLETWKKGYFSSQLQVTVCHYGEVRVGRTGNSRFYHTHSQQQRLDICSLCSTPLFYIIEPRPRKGTPQWAASFLTNLHNQDNPNRHVHRSPWSRQSLIETLFSGASRLCQVNN